MRKKISTLVLVSFFMTAPFPLQSHMLTDKNKHIKGDYGKDIDFQKPAEEVLKKINEEITSLEKEIQSKKIKIKRLRREADRVSDRDFTSARRKRFQAQRFEEEVFNLERKITHLNSIKKSFLKKKTLSKEEMLEEPKQ